MKHLQADLSTYSKPKQTYIPKNDPFSLIVYTYSNEGVSSSRCSITQYINTHVSLSTYLKNRKPNTAYFGIGIIDDYIINTHKVVSTDMLEAYTALYLDYPDHEDNKYYEQCLQKFPEYFI